MDDSHNASPSFPRVHLAPPGAARVHQLQHMFQVAVACPNRDQPRQVPPRRGKSDQRTASGQHVVIWSDIQHLAASGNVCQEGGIAGYLEPWSGPPEGPQTICRFADEGHRFESNGVVRPFGQLVLAGKWNQFPPILARLSKIRIDLNP
jgi:hypothetical protein